MRLCGPLLITLLLLCMPAWAQVERNASNLTSRRSAGGSSRGGWINPSSSPETPVWTYRQEQAVRRVFKSITADGGAALARALMQQGGKQSIVSQLLPDTAPVTPALKFRLERDAAAVSEAAATDLPAEPASDTETADTEDALAVPAPDDAVEPDADNENADPIEESIPQPEVTNETAPSAPEAEAVDNPAPERGFRLRRNPDTSREGIGDLGFPEEAASDAAADETGDEAIGTVDDAELPDTAMPAAADLPQAETGFIPDKAPTDPAPARLRPAEAQLALPGRQAAPLQPGPGPQGSGLPVYEIRSDLKSISRGNGKLRQVALTFDDGPHPEYTGQLLAILDYYNAPATFFFVGVQANRYPEWLQMTHQQGHEIASQTYDHFRMPKLPQGEKEYQIDAYQELVEQLIGERPRFLRPPGGQIDEFSQRLLTERGMICALWDVALNDTTAGRTRDEMLEHVLANVRNGSVILAHDGIQATIDMLPELIEKLREEGYELVTMSQLASTI